MKIHLSIKWSAPAILFVWLAVASSPAVAGLVSTEETVLSAALRAVSGDSNMAREKVRRALTAHGVSRMAANDRVMALSDAEVWQLTSGGAR
jgi:hypothetical protein